MQLPDLEWVTGQVNSLEPKTRLMICSLSTVAITALILRHVIAARAALPGKLQSVGQVALTAINMGSEDETRRDYCRAFMGGCVTALPPGGAAPEPLVPPENLARGVDGAALEVQEAALLAALASSLGADGVSPTPGALRKLLPLLSVSPTIAVLSDAGVPPMVQQHRFVVQATLLKLGDSSEMRLRVLTVGFIGTPISGATPTTKHTPCAATTPRPSATASAPTRLAHSLTSILVRVPHPAGTCSPSLPPTRSLPRSRRRGPRPSSRTRWRGRSTRTFARRCPVR
jgi:hypothetical protein